MGVSGFRVSARLSVTGFYKGLFGLLIWVGFFVFYKGLFGLLIWVGFFVVCCSADGLGSVMGV